MNWKPKHSIVWSLFGLIALLPTVAPGQVQVEKRRAAPANGEVVIENSFGRVIVHGWEQNEVMVKGTLAPGSQGLNFGGEKRTYVEVDEPEHWFYAPSDDSDFQTHIEVFVPRGSKLDVETINADVEIYGVRGEICAETVNGSIRIEAESSHIDAQTMTGDITILASAARMRAESISGTVTLSGAVAEVEVDTVSGSVVVSGSDLASLSVETVTGSVSFRGSLAKQGDVDIETFSGDVVLVLPVNVKAEFAVETFSGQITSDIGPKAPVSRRFEPYRTLEFSTGFDEYDVEVTTHEGDVHLRVAVDPWTDEG